MRQETWKIKSGSICGRKFTATVFWKLQRQRPKWKNELDLHVDFESEEEDDREEGGGDRNSNQPVIQVHEISSNDGSNDGQQQSNEGVENLLKDLTMEDKDVQAPEKKVKTQEDSHFIANPIIEIGSSSRCTRSTTRANEQKVTNLNNFLENNDRVDDETKVPSRKSAVKREVSKSDEVHETDKGSDDSDKKRKQSTTYSHDLIRKRPRLASLSTRTSPKTLHDTIKGLIPEQKTAVTKMQLDLRSGSIGITVESVHEIFGLPIRGIDLLDSDDRSFGLKLTKEWRRQFQKMNIRPTDIMNLILQSDNTDFMFKMDFLVLFVNLMADCNSMGSCSLSFIAKLKNESMVTKINWSKYIFAKVKTGKEKWRRDNDMCFYSGPLTYLTVSIF
ncbi:hypothetical protein L6452_03146 [Arctium lappa]|uniref:Uncharacterized protein n=1 Tax=Arctium lappa TaxID=4217 RepID=A0ACB9FLZ8_ARCLA|nr:hypothetical protein L6452_03146 [Arctium lappa]